jgi:hypothetical protein
MHGGKRDKASRWLSTRGLLDEMAVRCDGSHTHLPWAISNSGGAWAFATAEEAEYPDQLCHHVVTRVVDTMIARGFQPAPVDMNSAALTHFQKKLKTRASVGKQPRGRRLPSLISEFSEIVEQASAPSTGSHKLLRRFVKRDSVGSATETFSVGVLRSPLQFDEEASKAKHPMDLPSTVPDII